MEFIGLLKFVFRYLSIYPGSQLESAETAHLVFSNRALTQQFVKADFVVFYLYLSALQVPLFVAVLGADGVEVSQLRRSWLGLNAAKIVQIASSVAELGTSVVQLNS